ncbi:error-prone DNA polymerase [Leifsonia bigeumensis]|uniref:Error-prone DNA polymerase n=1 Tax=Leifsonella bigeumensis TaxID=433643 RepID=A0ABP7FP96_9MICO
MGWHNPPVPWSEFERTLSGRSPDSRPAGADGGESPGWTNKRPPYRPPELLQPSEAVIPYAELHTHSNFSFLDGASHPEELLEEAVRLGLHAIALTDHDGFYGGPRMAEAAESFPQLKTVFGAELSLGLGKPQNGVADPEGSHLLVLARRQEGYHRLSGAITAAQLQPGAEKGRPRYDLDDLAEHAGGDWLVLTGCRKGRVRQALVTEGVGAAGVGAAARELDHLVDLFGRDNVAVELYRHGDPLDDAHNDALFAVAESRGLPVVATGNVHYATPDRHRLATALAAVRARRSLDDLDGWLPASGAAHLRSGAEMARIFARYPGAVERTVEFADALAFRLRSVRPGLPDQEVPPGHTPMSWLRHLVWAGVPRRYPGGLPVGGAERIESELKVIEEKDFPGYFLIVHDIVEEARRLGILCQGRGSAANSVVCYLLGITAVDAIAYQLPFERFLSSMREEEPDIDVDFDSERREEIIQYVYGKYGRENAAQVANVISYRAKAAVRDMAKALGHSPGQQDAWSQQVERWSLPQPGGDHDVPDAVSWLAWQVREFPRHLGIHSGGMVLTKRPVGEVVPIEHARMENRTVLQWDKDDCAWMGLVKFDLLGLGMLAALQRCFDLVEHGIGESWTLATIPKEEAGVYDMLCRADAVGVFQVESRAQLNTLPRLQPRRFYELVTEIALIRPGPIQGGAVHPYIRRKTGKETVTYAHPTLRPVLERTLGIPLFQEQAMQMAMALGDLSPDDASLLRRSIGSKRGERRISSLEEKLRAGMASKGISPEDAEDIYHRIKAFSDFGFAESHSISFALLVYASSWFKLHYPGAFLAALLSSQPMGFYSPKSLVADARRHGVEVRRPDILLSGVDAGLEALDASKTPCPSGRESCLDHVQPPVPRFDPAAAFDTADHRRDSAFAVRLGLVEVKGIGRPLAERIVAERESRGPYRDMPELVRRVGLTTAQLESLAAADAFDSLGLTMRQALWTAGAAAQDRAEFLRDTVVAVQPPLFAMPTELERLDADLFTTGVSVDSDPVRPHRSALQARGILTAAELRTAEPGRRIEVCGVVTHRQHPSTAGGITFLTLEDETGLANVICSPGVWKRYRRTALQSRTLVVRGMLERSADGVSNVLADRFETIRIVTHGSSRDFR